MRSDLIFGAMTHVPNRFLLTGVAAKATRRLHRPNTRIEDTVNEVLERFARANPLADGASTTIPELSPTALTQTHNRQQEQDEGWMLGEQYTEFDTTVIPPAA